MIFLALFMYGMFTLVALNQAFNEFNCQVIHVQINGHIFPSLQEYSGTYVLLLDPSQLQYHHRYYSYYDWWRDQLSAANMGISSKTGRQSSVYVSTHPSATEAAFSFFRHAPDTDKWEFGICENHGDADSEEAMEGWGSSLHVDCDRLRIVASTEASPYAIDIQDMNEEPWIVNGGLGFQESIEFRCIEESHIPFLFDNYSPCNENRIHINNKDEGYIKYFNDTSASLLADVERLYLSGMDILGTIPTWLGSLTNLKQLHLSSNRLTGTLPTELGNLRDLEALYLSGTRPYDCSVGNMIAGSLPTEMRRMSSLKHLNLMDNAFLGSLPPELSKLSASLHSLYLGGNQLNGTLSTTDLGLLTKLVTLDLSHNQFSGTINQTLRQLTNLKILDLHGNQFEGHIASNAFESLSKLQHLDLSFNALTGTLSKEIILQLDSIENLAFTSNALTGTIPILGDHLPLTLRSSLQRLSLTSNQFTGTLSSEVTMFSNLAYLSLQDNNLTGAIPFTALLSRSSNLRFLFLGSNHFTGTIDLNAQNSLLNSSLWVLDVHDNYLTGTLPTEISQLSNLEYLDLANNQLGGRVPTELLRLPYLQWLDLRNNSFEIPAEIQAICSGSDEFWLQWHC